MDNFAERDEQIIALTKAGYTAARIAEILQVHKRTVARVRVRAGVARPFISRMSADEIQRAAQMLDDGASYSEVARTLGRSRECVRTRFPGRSVWKPGSGAEYRRYMAALKTIPALQETR